MTTKLFPDARGRPRLPVPAAFTCLLSHTVPGVTLYPGSQNRGLGKEAKEEFEGPHCSKTASPTESLLRLVHGSHTGANFCLVPGVNACMCRGRW